MISVIVPIYNVEMYIKDCIESVLSQTYKDFELILIDDGSTDNSGKIIDEYKNMKNVRVIHQDNVGLAEARNVGTRLAIGSYICYLDADDVLFADYLSSMYKCAVQNDADLVMCDYCEITHKGKYFQFESVNGNEISAYDLKRQTPKFKAGRIEKQELWDRLCVSYYDHYSIATVVAWNKMIRKEFAVSHLFEISEKHEDEFWIMKLLLDAKNIIWNENVLYKYRIREGSLMQTKLSFVKEERVLDAYENRIQLANENRINVQIFVRCYAENVLNFSNTIVLCSDYSSELLGNRVERLIYKYWRYLGPRQFLRLIKLRISLRATAC